MADISLKRIDSRSFLQVGRECVEISDYQIKSSADGATELLITIKGTSEVFELSACLEELKEVTKNGKHNKYSR